MNNIISRETVKNDILGEQYEKITLSGIWSACPDPHGKVFQCFPLA